MIVCKEKRTRTATIHGLTEKEMTLIDEHVALSGKQKGDFLHDLIMETLSDKHKENRYTELNGKLKMLERYAKAITFFLKDKYSERHRYNLTDIHKED